MADDKDAPENDPRLELVDPGAGEPSNTLDEQDFEPNIEETPESPEGPDGDGGEQTPDDPDAPAEEDASEDAELPEFDPENDDVVAKYDAAYNREDGSPNLEAWGAKAGPDGKGLTDGDRAYAKKAYGLSDTDLDDIIEGQVAKNEIRTARFLEQVGGKDAYEAAFEWGSANYTQAQKEAFNTAMQKGGDDAVDAVLALQARMQKAGVKTPQAQQQDGPALRRPLRRPASPSRDVTNAGNGNAGGPGGSVKPFSTEKEFHEAIREAKGDGKKLAEVSKRAALSKF